MDRETERDILLKQIYNTLCSIENTLKLIATNAQPKIVRTQEDIAYAVWKERNKKWISEDGLPAQEVKTKLPVYHKGIKDTKESQKP